MCEPPKPLDGIHMIGILSDAHGNRPAFDLSIDILRRYGAARFIFLGDAVGYIPTSEVVSAIEELGVAISCVRGNHEDILVKGAFDPFRDEVYQHKIIKEKMNFNSLDFVMTWPTQLSLEFKAGTALFVHGSPQNPTSGYVYQDTDLDSFPAKEPFVFMGNTHRPFVRRHKGTTFINVGSCGMPRDHGALGSMVLFNDQTGHLRILRFDIQRKIQEALETMGQVHQSVNNLFNRITAEFEGELVDN